MHIANVKCSSANKAGAGWLFELLGGWAVFVALRFPFFRAGGWAEIDDLGNLGVQVHKNTELLFIPFLRV